MRLLVHLVAGKASSEPSEVAGGEVAVAVVVEQAGGVRPRGGCPLALGLLEGTIHCEGAEHAKKK